MKSSTKIQFLRGGLITSIQGKQINNLQHSGITTSCPMDYFLSKIGNLIMNNNRDDLCFEICKFGPKIKTDQRTQIQAPGPSKTAKPQIH